MKEESTPTPIDIKNSDNPKIDLQNSDVQDILSSEVEKPDVRKKKITIETTFDFWEILNRRAFSRNMTMQNYCFRLLELGLSTDKKSDGEDLVLEEA